MPCLFCDFVSGKQKKNQNGYPFIPVHETKRTLSFLSIDFPAHEEGHLLVIPKEHYESIENIPPSLRHELIDHCVLAIKVLGKRHRGCNLLLNNGKVAGQYVAHLHFHVIPRDPGDHIIIESWRKQLLSLAKFKKLSFRLRKDFRDKKQH